MGGLDADFVEASTHGAAGGFSAGELLNDEDDTGSLLPVAPRLTVDGGGHAIVVYPTVRPGALGDVDPVAWAPMSSGSTRVLR